MAAFYDEEARDTLGPSSGPSLSQPMNAAALGTMAPSQRAFPRFSLANALTGAAYGTPQGQAVMQGIQQQEAFQLQKRQANQQGMFRFAELLGQYGQLPAGAYKDFFGTTLSRLYESQTGAPLDPAFLTMIKKQDEEQIGATAGFVRQLATQYGVGLDGFDTLIKSQPDKALALVVQSLNAQKTASDLQRARTRAQVLQQLQGIPAGTGEAPMPAGETSGTLLGGGMSPGAEPLMAPQASAPGLRPRGTGGLPSGAMPPVAQAKRDAIAGQMERLLPLTADDEGINKAYNNLEQQLKRLDDQAHRAAQEARQTQEREFQQARQTQELAISKAHLGVSQAQLQVSRMNAVREAETAALRRQELSLDIAKRQRESSGAVSPTEQRKLLMDIRSQVRDEKPFKDFQAARGGYQSLQEGFNADNTAGDLAIVNGINRLFNPDSTVMLGEARNVEQAQGTLQQLLNLPKQFFTGQRLSPQFRPQLMALGKALYTRWSTNADRELGQIYAPLAEQIGVPVDRFYVSPLKALDEAPAGLTKQQRDDVDAVLKASGFK